MTRETSYTDNTYTYRLDPDDARTIQRKANWPYARWHFYLRRDTATEAKIALIQIGRADDDARAAAQVQP